VPVLNSETSPCVSRILAHLLGMFVESYNQPLHTWKTPVLFPIQICTSRFEKLVLGAIWKTNTVACPQTTHGLHFWMHAEALLLFGRGCASQKTAKFSYQLLKCFVQIWIWNKPEVFIQWVAGRTVWKGVADGTVLQTLPADVPASATCAAMFSIFTSSIWKNWYFIHCSMAYFFDYGGRYVSPKEKIETSKLGG